jgi:DNA-binding MarR family transcriptional regulator/ribosomal protein S18 acetylase RimI-like enzyme
MAFIKELGLRAFGSRLKNLSDYLMQDVLKTYKKINMDFEPRWFTVFQLLLARRTVSITEIAHELDQSHPAVVQVVNILEKKGLVATGSDPGDQRKRMVSLSPKGMETAKKLQDTWTDVFMATDELLRESDPDFLEHLSMLENALSYKGLYDRIKEKISARMIAGLNLVPYRDEHEVNFNDLNISWLKEYLEVTGYDQRVLSDPKQEILSKDGFIYMLTLGEEVIGCFAVRKIDRHACELLKFTIGKDHRGWGLGRFMLNHAIEKATVAGYQKMLLFTDAKLKEANQLYREEGFRVIDEYPGFSDQTGRSAILMQLNINP